MKEELQDTIMNKYLESDDLELEKDGD